ncbi:MAG: PQQ-binding-like beta-propeller repeat protein [Anaerolineales bacterium]
MNTKRLILIPLLLLTALLVSSCGTRGPATTNWSGLSADADRAYLASGSFVYAVDLKTGLEVWRYPAAADSKRLFYSTPVLTQDGQLLINSEGSTHDFLSLDPATGKENWAAPFNAKAAWVAPALASDGKIYAPNTDGFLYTLDMSGKQISDPIEIGGSLWSAPVTDGSNLYVTSLDHHLHVIKLSDNSSQVVDLGGAAPSSPVVGKEGAYVGSFASKIESVSSSADHKAIADATNWIWGTPVVDGDTLYYADLNGNVFSYDIASGKQNWTNVKLDGPVVAGLLVMGNQIYAGTEAGSLYALDQNGKTVWNKSVGGNLYTTPVYSSDLVIVAPYLQADYILAAYDADGKQAWTFMPAKK